VELNRAMTNVCFKNNIKDQVTLKECSILEDRLFITCSL